MAVTYTAAVERVARRTERWTDRLDLTVLLVAATSCVAVLAIALAYAGRLSAFEMAGHRAAAAPVNLNTVADARPIEAALQAVFADANDRQLAAQQLFTFLGEERQKKHPLGKVGGIAPLFRPADLAKMKPRFTVR